ncbi:cell surface protein [Enterococcus villorum]|uniref:Cell surface protein n=1 Tax=Enterococcus villorum TaxID=112904 RepID=A0A1V8YAF1_9ENTE|nr:WxL domain-containing protein [Enterococcus villorum]OQO69579.1 cell surface protein [Enterococcus villorum]OQO72669.1 cell surface protein [Enterococcus villorum]
MKSTKLLATSLILAGGLLGATSAKATADYESATKVITNGQVEFLENDEIDDNIPDPENPEEPVEPEEPVNPNPGQLKINYVSAFNFGRQGNVSNRLTVNTVLDSLISRSGQEKKRVPFIATEDRRGTERKGWELRVSQPNSFRDSADNELAGATLTLNNLRYVNSVNAPTVTGGDIVLNSDEQVLAKADETQGAGAWSLALGNPTTEGTTDGVTLDIPANTIKNVTTYSTTLVWELIADPSANLPEEG